MFVAMSMALVNKGFAARISARVFWTWHSINSQ